MRLLPFNFDRLTESEVIITNVAGFHRCISSDDLSTLVYEPSLLDCEAKEDLQSGLFLAEGADSSVLSASLASGLSKRLMAEMTFQPVYMIIPTLRCDHTCSYCQVSRASINASNYDLDKSLIPLIMRKIRSLSQPPYKIEIQGGEPLLRFDLIQAIYDEAVKVLGDSFEIVIATSLSLFNEEVLVWSSDKPINFSTSLDGSGLVHDANRILPGTSSFTKFSDSFWLIKERLGADRVSSVTTVTSELIDNPHSLINAALELGLNDLFVRPISPYGFAGHTFEYSISDYMRFYSELMASVIDLNLSGRRLTEHSAAIHLKRIFNPGFSHYADLKSPSGFLFNSLLFNYDGKVYGSDEARMLQRVATDVDLSFGHVETLDFTANTVAKHVMENGFNLVQPGCESCAYQPYCGVDPMQNISLFGEPVGLKSNSFYCTYHKSMFRYLFSKYYSDCTYKNMFDRWTDE
ncbi:His-Xaa-Ser system radical SAM maturase HxsB [Litoribrevibacter albus]|uniref:His-Xaa-Ser system radical SAM maturase HxsB n=1 Tax=Litoribrevibacter albus TaxID=1473156 RepID=A0AA37W540_9GAMM|nr:His-Xaa-Ser system radical SAM maturase HxsB [Litoribrevibacter albus]GLQ30747.1 His-Xaa-Ser system radical SAM maturase HxsB [Litoribrevibacter albus]